MPIPLIVWGIGAAVAAVATAATVAAVADNNRSSSGPSAEEIERRAEQQRREQRTEAAYAEADAQLRQLLRFHGIHWSTAIRRDLIDACRDEACPEHALAGLKAAFLKANPQSASVAQIAETRKALATCDNLLHSLHSLRQVR